MSVARLIPNPWLFLEATGEVFRGDSDRALPFEQAERSRATSVICAAYQDITEDTNIDLGFSYGARPQRSGIVDGDRRRPLHDGPVRHRRDVPLAAAAALDLSLVRRPLRSGSGAGAIRLGPGSQAGDRGIYVSGDYQFARRWFAGARFDRSGSCRRRVASCDTGGSLTLTFWPSEFSQVRGQYRRTKYADGTDGERVPVPVPVLDRRARRASVLTPLKSEVRPR